MLVHPFATNYQFYPWPRPFERPRHCLWRHGYCPILTRMERPTLTPHDRFRRRQLIAAMAGAALAGLLRVRRVPIDPQLQVGYLRWMEPRPTNSLLDRAPPDNGLAGAKLAISDDEHDRAIHQPAVRACGCADPRRRLSGSHAHRFWHLTAGLPLILCNLPGRPAACRLPKGRARAVVLLDIREAG